MNISFQTRFFIAILFLAITEVVTGAPSPATYFPGQIVVKFKPTPPDVTVAQTHIAGAQIKAKMPRLGWQLVQLPAGVEVQAALEYYRTLTNVAYAEPNYRIHLFKTPNDPRWPELWGLHKINAEPAWDQTTGLSNIVVATLDTGIDYNHPDLATNIWTNAGEIPGNSNDDDGNGYIDDVHGFNTLNHNGDVRDDEGHGTHVAGTIGAAGNNNLGVVGINWRVSILSVKIFSADDSAGTAGAAEGYEYLLALKQHGVNIRWSTTAGVAPCPVGRWPKRFVPRKTQAF